MNWALWKKALGEVRLTLPSFVLLMFCFQVLFVWLTSQVELQFVAAFLRNMPEMWRKLLPVSIESLTTYSGRVAIGYEHPLVVFGFAFWSISRGSDSVSGPLGRGTMEMLLAQPIRRSAVLWANAGVTTLGCALMALFNWLGTWTGIACVPKMRDIPTGPYAYCALNMFCHAFFVAGLTTLFSSADRSRGRTIGIAVTFYIFAMLLKVVGKVSDSYHALLYGSFLAAVEPLRFVDSAYDPIKLSWQYDTTLLAGGVACYLAALVTFTRRDLPAPL